MVKLTMAKISRKTKFDQLLAQCPEAAEVLAQRGFHCLGCVLASFETLEEGARAHGLSEAEIDQLVAEINQLLEQQTEQDMDQGAKEKVDEGATSE